MTVEEILKSYEKRMEAERLIIATLRKQLPDSRPSPQDPENSVRCGHCKNDIELNDGYRYCPYCGGKI